MVEQCINHRNSRYGTEDERDQFMNLHHLPGRLNEEEAAWYLGVPPSQMYILVASKLIEPLGQPAPNGPKHFAIERLDRYRCDRQWVALVNEELKKANHQKNHGRDNLSDAGKPAGN